jgi:hypothetical protein
MHMIKAKKAKMIIEQPVMWLLLLIFGFIIAYVIYKLIATATEKGLPAIFG